MFNHQDFEKYVSLWAIHQSPNVNYPCYYIVTHGPDRVIELSSDGLTTAKMNVVEHLSKIAQNVLNAEYEFVWGYFSDDNGQTWIPTAKRVLTSEDVV